MQQWDCMNCVLQNVAVPHAHIFEGSQTHQKTYCVIPFLWSSKTSNASLRHLKFRQCSSWWGGGAGAPGWLLANWGSRLWSQSWMQKKGMSSLEISSSSTSEVRTFLHVCDTLIQSLFRKRWREILVWGHILVLQGYFKSHRTQRIPYSPCNRQGPQSNSGGPSPPPRAPAVPALPIALKRRPGKAECKPRAPPQPSAFLKVHTPKQFFFKVNLEEREMIPPSPWCYWPWVHGPGLIFKASLRDHSSYGESPTDEKALVACGGH